MSEYDPNLSVQIVHSYRRLNSLFPSSTTPVNRKVTLPSVLFAGYGVDTVIRHHYVSVSTLENVSLLGVLSRLLTFNSPLSLPS